MSENGNFPFIGASGENNGVTGFTTKKDVENNNQIRANLLDDSSRILPLLYDENAEYSIRDVDMLNGIG